MTLQTDEWRDLCMCISDDGRSPAWFFTPRDKWCKNCRDRASELLQNYGYTKADQDGYDGEKVSAEAHKEEEMFSHIAGELQAEVFA